MPEDPRALKICIDGNAYRNPGGPGGCAGFVVYPEDWNKPSEEIFRVGFQSRATDEPGWKMVRSYRGPSLRRFTWWSDWVGTVPYEACRLETMKGA